MNLRDSIQLTFSSDENKDLLRMNVDNVLYMLGQEEIKAERLYSEPKFRTRGIAPASTFLSELNILIPAVSAGLGTVLGAWLNGHNNRKVKLKVGEIEAEANNMEDLQKLLERADQIKQASIPKQIVTLT